MRAAALLEPVVRSAASLLLLVCLAGSAAARGASSSSFADIQKLLDAGQLRVAILARDAPPMIMTGRSGELTGSEVDLARDIGSKLGVPVRFVRTATTYDGVVEVVARGEADIAVSFLSAGAERAKRVLFSRPYVTQNRRIVYNRRLFAALKRDHDVDSITDLPRVDADTGLVVGVLEGSIYESFVTDALPRAEVRRFQSVAPLVRAVREGELIAAMHGDLQLQYHLNRNPELAIHVALAPTGRSPSDIRIAVQPGAPNLLRWIDLYLDNHVGVLDSSTIVRRYLER